MPADATTAHETRRGEVECATEDEMLGWTLLACHSTAPGGDGPALPADPVGDSGAGTSSSPEDTSAPQDTAWWTETGGSSGGAPDLAACDLDGNGAPDAGAVVVYQPGGAALGFSDLAAALSVAETGADLVLCPGPHDGNALVERSVDLVAWDSGVADRPTVVPRAEGAALTVAAGATVRIVGLRLEGSCFAGLGGGGGTGAASAGGSGASPPAGGTGAGAGGTGAGGGSGAGPIVCLPATGVSVAAGGALELRHVAVGNFGAGGVRAENAASVDIVSSTLRGNIGGDGAGLYLSGCGAASLDDVAFVRNVATGDGGALFVSDCALAASGGVTVRDNAAARGGGVYAEWATLVGGSWVVEENTAETDGGGVCLRASSLDPLDLRITDNVAGDGGGVWLDGGALAIGTVTGNVAERGGGVYAQAGSGAVTLGAELVDNEATSGGGLYVASGEVVAAGARVAQNRATGESGGGAVVDAGAHLVVSAGDWGSPLLDDNEPPDVFPVELGVNQALDTGACADCTSYGCTACP